MRTESSRTFSQRQTSRESSSPGLCKQKTNFKVLTLFRACSFSFFRVIQISNLGKIIIYLIIIHITFYYHSSTFSHLNWRYFSSKQKISIIISSQQSVVVWLLWHFKSVLVLYLLTSDILSSFPLLVFVVYYFLRIAKKNIQGKKYQIKL